MSFVLISVLSFAFEHIFDREIASPIIHGFMDHIFALQTFDKMRANFHNLEFCIRVFIPHYQKYQLY